MQKLLLQAVELQGGARGCLGFTPDSSGMVTPKQWEPHASKIQALLRTKRGLPHSHPRQGCPTWSRTSEPSDPWSAFPKSGGSFCDLSEIRGSAFGWKHCLRYFRWRPGTTVLPAPMQEPAGGCSLSLPEGFADVLGSFLRGEPSPQQVPGLFRDLACLTCKDTVLGD